MEDIKFIVDKEKCVKCGHCVIDCMPKVIELDEDGFPYAKNPQRCMKCQHCLAICPAGAISVLGKKPENSEPISSREPEKILNLIKTRRSFRHYKKENLPQETMDKLKNMLNWVPTGINYHKLHFAFVDDIEVMNDIRDYTNNKLVNVLSKPLINKVFKKFERYKKAIINGQDIVFRGAPHMVVVSVPNDATCKEVDPMIALSYFELYAQSMGVATVWCGIAYAVMKFFPELCKQMEIPDGYKLAYVMLFGPNDVQYFRGTQPEPFEVVSVKKSNRKMSFVEKIKRLIWNAR